MTVWRAKPPTGYAVAGDIVTPGALQVTRAGCLRHACATAACATHPGGKKAHLRWLTRAPLPSFALSCLQPTFEVLAVAVNSGLAAFPLSYTRVWSGAGGAIWRPVPPPGYVAVGDLVTCGDEEPELSAMVCLHGGWLSCR